MEKTRSNHPGHNLDARVRVSVLHGAIVLDNFLVVEDIVGHLRENGHRHEDRYLIWRLYNVRMKESDLV